MNQIEPTAVDVSHELIKITWSDGITHQLNARLLRAACNCATCVSEVTGERIIDISKISEDIQINAAEPTGNYAISIRFSDAHSTGIYTYEYLRELGEGRTTHVEK